jgi:Protein of unknown function (DUF3277)
MASFVAYSFLDVVATLVGPNGTVSLGSNSGVSEEGVSFSFSEDQDTMTIGADGTGMHSLHAGQAGTVSVRFLKSSPTNAILDALYQADRNVPSTSGQNTIVVTWLAGGDVTTAFQCAFKKFPDVVYGKDAALLEWVFNSIRITPLLGAGQ